jgi:hypothetical protein
MSSLEKICPVCQDNSPRARIADWSSRNAVNNSSACHNETLSVVAMRVSDDPPHAMWLRVCALGRVVVLMSGLPWRLTRLIVVLSLIGFLMSGNVAEAGSFLDFFRAIGNSIAHPEKKSQSHTKSTKQPASEHAASPKPSLGTSPGPPKEDNVRTASAAPEAKGGKADVPYAIPVPGKQGFVISPFAPDSGYVDVHQFRPGTAVKDPFTGRVFLTP